MLSFFKRNKKEKLSKQGSDSTVSTQDLLNEEEETTSEEEVVTELSIHPMMNVTTEQTYVLRFLNNELPPLKPNQVSLSGIELDQDEDQLIVSAFIRNSLSKGIQFQNTTLLLLGPNEERIARKEFDLSELDELPARSSRPWNFIFEPQDLFTHEIPTTGWKLAFEIQTKSEHRLDLDESWEESLPEKEKEKLKELVKRMDPPKEGEVNFMGLQAKQNENGDLLVTMLIRNGSNNNVQLQQIPLQVEDASGNIVAKGGFTLDNFEVKAHTSKPWTFVFPKNMVLTESIDLSKWKAVPAN